jgi:glycosyltransferase involved in cell wall biosynthesis
LKILIASGQFPPTRSGYARVASELHRSFSTKGHDVEVITEGRGCRRTAGTIAVLTEEGRGVLREGWDIVQIIGPTPLFTEQCARYAAHQGLPVVYTLNAFAGLADRHANLFTRAVDSAYQALVYHPALARSRTLVFQTADHSCSMRRPSHPSRAVIPYGLDERYHDALDPGENSPHPAPSALSAEGEDGAARVLFVGQLRQYKGVRYLIEATRELRALGLHLRLDLVGNGPDALPLTEEIRRSGLADCAFVHTNVDDLALRRFYSRADVLVLPSVSSESFGLVLLEAAAHGAAVVSTDLPGVREVSRDLGGLVVPVRDGMRLAMAIAAKLSTRRPAQASTAVRRDLSRYSWNAVAEGYLDLYNEILHLPSRGGLVSGERASSEGYSGPAVQIPPRFLPTPKGELRDVGQPVVLDSR